MNEEEKGERGRNKCRRQGRELMASKQNDKVKRRKTRLFLHPVILVFLCNDVFSVYFFFVASIYHYYYHYYLLLS